jgi:folate-binding protein YgfZ
MYFSKLVRKKILLVLNPTNEAEHHLDWSEVELAYELPSLNIIESGLLPNEIKWLESFVDFYKGCFMGQEQASRVKFRGNPRRILKTLPNSTQEIVKK